MKAATQYRFVGKDEPIKIEQVNETTALIDGEEMSLADFNQMIKDEEIIEVEPELIEEEEVVVTEPDPEPTPEPAPAQANGRPYRAYSKGQLEEALERYREILRTDKTDTAQEMANGQSDLIEEELTKRP